MITGINESKTLTKHISCECKCKFDKTKYNLNQWWNNNKCGCECKKHPLCEKDYVWNTTVCICENGKYLASIMDDSVITCDEIIDVEETNFNEITITCKRKCFYILLAFLLITIALLIAVSIYYYMIKVQAKKNIYYHFTTQN